MRLWKWQKQLFIKPKNLPEEQRIITGRIGRISSLLVIEDDPEKRYVPKNTRSVWYLRQKRVRERLIIKSEYKYLPQKAKDDRIDSITIPLRPPSTLCTKAVDRIDALCMHYSITPLLSEVLKEQESKPCEE